MNAEAPALDPARYHGQRPSDIRGAPPWNRLAYIARALPAELEELSGELGLDRGGRLLDFGCADAPYRRLFPAAEYVGADLPGNPAASVEIGPDGRLPVAEASFDAALSTQVLEHAADPRVHLEECFRVLRPGGRLLLSTHGIMVYHPDPVDLWRFTCEGLRSVVEQAGFEIVRFEGVMGLAATGLQLFQDGLIYRLPRILRPPLALLVQTLIAVIERFQGGEGRRMNALVFALVARKP